MYDYNHNFDCGNLYLLDVEGQSISLIVEDVSERVKYLDFKCYIQFSSRVKYVYSSKVPSGGGTLTGYIFEARRGCRT